MDATKLGFRDGTFDAAVAPYVLTVVPDPESVLDEIARVVRPGGEIVLVNHIGAERGLRAAIEAWLGKRSAALGWRPEFPWAILDRWLARSADDHASRAPQSRPAWPVHAHVACSFAPVEWAAEPVSSGASGGASGRPRTADLSDSDAMVAARLGSLPPRPCGAAALTPAERHDPMGTKGAACLRALERPGHGGRMACEWTSWRCQLVHGRRFALGPDPPRTHHQEVIPMHFDRPEGKPDEKIGWGSDVAAAMLRRFGFPYVSLNPGASYRGLHDSIVNHLGNETPSMVLCLHEDHAVAIAHGYAKATGEPMACILHSNVGLMHGMMSLYNAWCDRVPMFVLGATGPVDSAQRRPWIDWIHTSTDQGGLIRDFVKWDNQPTSPAALVEAMCRANIVTRSEPTAPVYICLDAGLQEASLDTVPDFPDMSRVSAAAAAAAAGRIRRRRGGASCRRAPAGHPARPQRRLDRGLERPRRARRAARRLRPDRSQESRRFPTDHPAHVVSPFNQMSPAAREVLAEADVILALEWLDLGNALNAPKNSPAVSGTGDQRDARSGAAQWRPYELHATRPRRRADRRLERCARRRPSRSARSRPSRSLACSKTGKAARRRRPHHGCDDRDEAAGGIR